MVRIFTVTKLHRRMNKLLWAELVVQSFCCRKKRPAIPHLQTPSDTEGEGDSQCCDGVQQGLGLVVHQRRLLHPPLSNYLHWVKGISQDRAGPPHQPVQSLPVSSWNAAAPAKYSKEYGRCHHSHKSSSGAPPVVQKTAVSWADLLGPFLNSALAWSVQSSLLFWWTPRHL